MPTGDYDRRKSDLARIHIAANQLGLIRIGDDGAYRDMLFTVARVRTAGDLDADGRRRVLDYLNALGAPAHRGGRHHAGAPRNIDSADRGPMLRKIEAYLAEAHRPWAYARGMAQRMFHVDQLEFASPAQLRGLIAALEQDARRHGRRTA
jgi:phage gp16-like protein